MSECRLGDDVMVTVWENPNSPDTVNCEITLGKVISFGTIISFHMHVPAKL
jgi:hypothetical protein